MSNGKSLKIAGGLLKKIFMIFCRIDTDTREEEERRKALIKKRIQKSPYFLYGAFFFGGA